MLVFSDTKLCSGDHGGSNSYQRFKSAQRQSLVIIGLRFHNERVLGSKASRLQWQLPCGKHNIDLILDDRLRRWPSNKSTQCECLVLKGLPLRTGRVRTEFVRSVHRHGSVKMRIDPCFLCTLLSPTWLYPARSAEKSQSTATACSKSEQLLLFAFARQLGCSAKANSSNWLTEKWAVTAVCLCTAPPCTTSVLLAKILIPSYTRYWL